MGFTITRDLGSTDEVDSYVQAQAAIAFLSVFEFAYFFDLTYTDWSPGPTFIVNGRVHANGDLCISGRDKLVFQRVTAAGRLMTTTDKRCRYQTSYYNGFIANVDDLSTSNQLLLSGDNGCTHCQGTGKAWKAYAESRWNGHAQDVAFGVNQLILPANGTPTAQTGADGANTIYRGVTADAYQTVSNNKSLRYIVDPVLPTDSAGIKSQKFSGQADIRIMDGVWYLNNQTWPGVPIWSDHPGHFVDPYSVAAGQEDIRTYWASMAWPWAATPPSGYSYYAYDNSTHSLINYGGGTISYGSLGKGGPGLEPGFFVGSSVTLQHNLCGRTGIANTSGFLLALNNTLTCSTPRPQPNFATDLLLATRTGFTDGHVLLEFPYTDDPGPYKGSNVNYYMQNILPVNFDLNQFQQALTSTSPGQLGSYFGAGHFMNHKFNGILFITTTWPSSNLSTPVYYPPQGFDFNRWVNTRDNVITPQPDFIAAQIITITPPCLFLFAQVQAG